MSLPSLPDTLRQLTCLAEIRGDAESHALRAATAQLDRLTPDDLRDLVDRARTTGASIPELSLAATERLRQIVLHGAEVALAAARARVPSLHRRLLERGVITHDHAVTLARSLSAATWADLEALLSDGRLARLPAVVQERLVRAAADLFAAEAPLPLGRAHEILSSCRDIVARVHGVDDVQLAGDVRRFEPLVRSMVIVARAARAETVLDALSAAPEADDVLYRDARRAIVRMRSAEVDLRVAPPDEFGTILLAATGTPGHVAAIRRRHSMDLRPREEDLYARAGLPWIPPEMRNHSGEVEAAAAGRLPRLVERHDIRGDLHMHSTYSDGQDTVEAMLRAAAALGYEYVAITDHSENAGASRTVTGDQLARQRDEIERLRPLFPTLEILHGLEVDILPDGRLDCADAVLERLDIVLASLHDAAGHDAASLTHRCLEAIRHPLVHVITHPANQLVGRRPGYQMDYEAIYAAAAETGTALEVDGAPSHLDLDGAHARAAILAGVTLTIDSDSHRAAALERQMTFGVGTARRGWVEARHVLNPRPIAEVRAFLDAKRSRRS